MNKLLKKILILAGVFMLALSLAAPAFAAGAPARESLRPRPRAMSAPPSG